MSGLTIFAIIRYVPTASKDERKTRMANYALETRYRIHGPVRLYVGL